MTSCVQDLGYGDVVPVASDLGDEASAPPPVNTAPIKPNRRVTQKNNFSLYNIDSELNDLAAYSSTDDDSESSSDDDSESSEDEEQEDGAVDLGYGDETPAAPVMVTAEDLGYGDEAPAPSPVKVSVKSLDDLDAADLGYGEEAAGYAPVYAAPIKPDRRGSKRNNFSIYGNLDLGFEQIKDLGAHWSSDDDSESDYSEEDSDSEDEGEEGVADMVHATLDHRGSYFDKRLTLSGARSDSVGCGDDANPNLSAEAKPYTDEQMPFYALGSNLAMQVSEQCDLKTLLDENEMRIVLEAFCATLKGTVKPDPGTVVGTYGPQANQLLQERTSQKAKADGVDDTPHRVSLQITQSSNNNTRSGRLDVSIGTSSLSRRLQENDSTASMTSLASFASASSCSSIVGPFTMGHRDSTNSTSSANSTWTSTSEGRASSFAHSPGRRITMGHRDSTNSAPCSSSVTRVGSFAHRPGRRITMDNSGGCTPSATRRTTMDLHDTRPAVRATPRQQQAMRRTTMDLHDTRPAARATPRQQQAMRRTTMEHNAAQSPPSVRRITRNTTSRLGRLTSMDVASRPSAICSSGRNSSTGTQASGRSMLPHRRVGRNSTMRPTRRITLDHCTDRSPITNDPAPARPSLKRSTKIMAGAPNSMTGRRLTMDLTSKGSVVDNRSRSPPRRMAPRRTYSITGRAA